MPKKLCHPRKPCDNCPFRRENGIRLHKHRVIEIVEQIAPANHQGSSFSCHKTVNYEERDPKSELLCTGGLIFAYKQDASAQLTRIMERLGLVDQALVDDAWPEIFDDLDQMLATAIPMRRSRSRRAR